MLCRYLSDFSWREGNTEDMRRNSEVKKPTCSDWVLQLRWIDLFEMSDLYYQL